MIRPNVISVAQCLSTAGTCHSYYEMTETMSAVLSANSTLPTQHGQKTLHIFNNQVEIERADSITLL